MKRYEYLGKGQYYDTKTGKTGKLRRTKFGGIYFEANVDSKEEYFIVDGKYTTRGDYLKATYQEETYNINGKNVSARKYNSFIDKIYKRKTR